VQKIIYMKKLCLLLFAATIIMACNQPAGTKDAVGSFNLDSVKAAIAANNDAFTRSIEKGDSALFVSLYTADGCVMPDGGAPKMCGAEGLSQFFGMAGKMGIHSIKLTTTEVIGGKELVSEEGAYEIIGDAGKTLDKGKFIVTWKEEKGTWKKYRDIWNTDMPPAAAATK
jgi:ketosteroid isomerase-like protein